MEELICDILNDVSALSDFEDITFYLLELQNITFIEKCFRILVVFGGIPLKCIVVLLLIYSHQFTTHGSDIRFSGLQSRS